MLTVKVYKNKKGVLRVSLHANVEDLKDLKNAFSSKPVPSNPMGIFMPLFAALKNVK